MSITGVEGDVDLTTPSKPYMAVLGEPLDPMVKNLGQTDNSYVYLGATNKVVSQGFTTGSNEFGYRLQGIGVNIEGSGGNYPNSPTSVSVAVYNDRNGRPSGKLFDLFSPAEFGAGHSFFEAPPGATLDSGHLLRAGMEPPERRRAPVAADLQQERGLGRGNGRQHRADAYRRGASVGRLSQESCCYALEIAVYTEVNTEPPEEPPFDPGGVTGGGPGPFRRRRHPNVLRPAGRTLHHVRPLRLGRAHHLLFNHNDGGRVHRRHLVSDLPT